GLIADSSGNLYGTTIQGGASNTGVVFKLSPGGTETVLHSFKLDSNGANPVAGLIADSAGNLYGTTESGGASQRGVVFKLSPDGTSFMALHSFCVDFPLCSDGRFPQAGLIADSAGNLYGTTRLGGASDNGVVFKLSPDGSFAVLHSFTGSDGFLPEAGLIADNAGNLYGTTLAGGGGSGCLGSSGCGVVFKLSPGGTETVLHSFTGGSDGSGPTAGLIADSAGNLYGTTTNGGGGGGPECVGSGCGVVFKLSPGGTETVLHSFSFSDGANPGALIADSAGNLYGTTLTGGASNGGAAHGGVVFKLSPGGTYTVLYTFCRLPSCSDGDMPAAGLIADNAGNLHATTSNGGANAGVVFKLAGTGFAIPFSAFRGKLEIEFGPSPKTDSFELKARFTLGSASNGINPPTEPLTLNVGTFTTTIPPGSFKAHKGSIFGPFTFDGVINGVALEVRIAPTGAKRYSFRAEGDNASLTGTANPVPVTLSLGDDGGTVSVNADIGH
ncbi:MAG TPA: choice-of-anchor tandem repeat GloVer-containing protein, partial [Methylocella sp.]